MGPGVPSVAVFLSWVLGSRPRFCVTRYVTLLFLVALDACFFTFAPILGFGSRVSRARLLLLA